MSTDPLDWLEARARLERRVRDAAGDGAEVWMTDGYLVCVANVDGCTTVVAEVSVRAGDPDSVIRSLYALGVLVGA